MGARRNTAAPGLTYVEANYGRVERYTLDATVIRAHRNIERDYPRLQCLWDKENHEHVIVEHCRDGKDRLVWAGRHFVEDVVRAMLNRGNSEHFDLFEEMEKSNAAWEKEFDYRIGQQVMAAGEKLAHAFAKDGLTIRPRMTPISVKLKKQKTLRTFEAPSRRMISNR